MHLNHKSRWIFSPLVKHGNSEIPLAAEYALQYEAPMHHEGYALTHCVMNAHQLAAARADLQLIVLPSVHSRVPIPGEIVTHHAVHGVTAGMLLHEVLEQLAKYHPNFAPEE